MLAWQDFSAVGDRNSSAFTVRICILHRLHTFKDFILFSPLELHLWCQIQPHKVIAITHNSVFFFLALQFLHVFLPDDPDGMMCNIYAINTLDQVCTVRVCSLNSRWVVRLSWLTVCDGCSPGAMSFEGWVWHWAWLSFATNRPAKMHNLYLLKKNRERVQTDIQLMWRSPLKS